MKRHNTYPHLTPDALDRLQALPLVMLDDKAIDFLFVTLDNIKQNMTDDPDKALEAFNESVLWLLNANPKWKEEFLSMTE